MKIHTVNEHPDMKAKKKSSMQGIICMSYTQPMQNTKVFTSMIQDPTGAQE